MRRQRTRKIVVAGLAMAAAALLLAGIPTGARAQDSADGTWMRVDIVQILPRELDEYIEIQLEDVNPALRRAGVPWRSAWSTAEFGNTYERQFVTPISSMGDFDTGGPLARALEPDRLARIRDRVRQTLSSRQSFAIRYHPELSVESDDVSGLSLARVTTVQVAPGRIADWREFLRDNLPLFEGANIVFGVYERFFGPGPSTWQLVENHASFAELDEPGILARTFGEGADEVASRLSGVLLTVERSVLRYDPALSFSAATGSSQ